MQRLSESCELVTHPMSANDLPTTKPEDGLNLGILTSLVGRNLRIAHALAFRDFAFEIDGNKLTPGSFETLELLANNQGLRPSRLAAVIGLDKSSLTPALVRLESMELIDRKVSTSDGRAYEMRITPKGRAALRKLQAYVQAREAVVTSALDSREVDELNKLLRKVASSLA